MCLLGYMGCAWSHIEEGSSTSDVKMVSMRVGRFQVMAVLQAARAHMCGLSLDESKSWGLNRAIFYAAAKRGFRAVRTKPPTLKISDAVVGRRYIKKRTAKEEVSQLGDEIAYRTKVGDNLYYAIGGENQTPEDYSKQVMLRFGGKYRQAWEEALEMVRKHPKSVLLSQSEFFQQVYKPVRDELSEKWTQMAASG